MLWFWVLIGRTASAQVSYTLQSALCASDSHFCVRQVQSFKQSIALSERHLMAIRKYEHTLKTSTVDAMTQFLHSSSFLPPPSGVLFENKVRGERGYLHNVELGMKNYSRYLISETLRILFGPPASQRCARNDEECDYSVYMENVKYVFPFPFLGLSIIITNFNLYVK